MVRNINRQKSFNREHGIFKSLAHDRSGGFAVTFAVCSVVLVGAAGLAIDYSHITLTRSNLQESLDAAVLAGVAYVPDAKTSSGVKGPGISKDGRLDIARKFFDSELGSADGSIESSFAFNGEVLEGSATARVKTSLMAVLGRSSSNVAAAAKATSEPFRVPACILAMHPARKHTLELNDTLDVIAPDCNIYGNSNHPDDVVDPHQPENFLVGKSVQAVGYGHHYLPNVKPPVEHAPELIPDPLAKLDLPSPGACKYSNIRISGGVTTLEPGSYCGGLSVANGAAVTLRPGLYNITGGSFVVNNATFKGDGVTVSLATPGMSVNWTDAKIQITAPKSGQYAGMAVIGARDPANHVIDASTIDITGVVYLIGGAFKWISSGSPDVSSKWTAWIVDGFSWSGDGVINVNFDINGSDVPYPKALYVIPRPGKPRLIE
jgi:Flp pilus assembly protein TadG